MADLTPSEVCVALKAEPRIIANVNQLWPLIVEGLHAKALTGRLTQCGLAATIGVENPSFKPVAENLNYSAHGLMAQWPKRFPSLELAEQYARQPEKIANFVYAGRNGNGPVESGDGWRYRGRGPIQVTGRANYAACGKALGVDLLVVPDRLLEWDLGAQSAVWFWDAHGLVLPCETARWEAVRRIVNGGLTHFADFLGILRGFGLAV